MSNNYYDNPWKWVKAPEPDGKKRLGMLVGGCMPASYSLFHKLDELTAGYDEVTIYGFCPSHGESERQEHRLYGCLTAWCKKNSHQFRKMDTKDFSGLSGYMQFIGEDTEHAALALYGNGYSPTLDIIKSFEHDTDVIYKEINGAYAA